jgi:hypothetical protein
MAHILDDERLRLHLESRINFAVDVHIVPSSEPPTGCGEPPVPVISPAVVNALARLTGETLSQLTTRCRLIVLLIL